MVRLMKLSIAFLFVFTACGDDNKPVMCMNPAGPAAGAHSGAMVQQTDQAACNAMPPDGGPMTDGGGNSGSDFGPTMFNAQGDDDDCKYHVSYTVTTVCENADVFFTALVTKKTDNS